MSATSGRSALLPAILALLLAACASGPATPGVTAPTENSVPTETSTPTQRTAATPSLAASPTAATPVPSPTHVDTPVSTTAPAPSEAPTASPVASAPVTPSPSPDTTGLSASYQHVGGEGKKHQTIALINDTPQGAEVVLDLVPLDAVGQPVDDVRVQTLLGSNGDGIIMPPGTTYDFLGFFGAGVAQVRDVRVEFSSVRRVAGSFASIDDVEHAVQLLGPAGSADLAGDPSGARRVRLTSRSPVPIIISLGYQVLEPRRGPHGAQNALALVVLADRVSVPARGTVTADITDEGIAALQRWGDTTRYQDLVVFLRPGQPFLTYISE